MNVFFINDTVEHKMFLNIHRLIFHLVIGGYLLIFYTVEAHVNISHFEKSNDRLFNETILPDNDDRKITAYDNFVSEKNALTRFEYFENPERILQKKVNVLARLLKIHVDRIREKTDQVELVFLVDASASVGIENFRSELNFVRKLLSDFTVEENATRVAVVTFAGRRHIVRHIDQISRNDEAGNQKCQLLNKQLGNVSYTGGGTYTRGALLEALAILQNSRETSEKVVFLITDGFSNSGDPRPAAKHLKNIGATIFTFGIRTGNIGELHDIASEPGYTHSYLLDSFPEFEALARHALHRDLKAGRYVPVKFMSDCNALCSLKNDTEEINGECCDELATCTCGTATGHYSCLCPRGYFGSGLKGFCQPCPNGTFDSGSSPFDSDSQCTPCTNVNHVTMKIPATSPEDCVCAPGFITDGENCEAIRCPKLNVPENGYFVKASACSNVVNAACGLRCRIGFNLIGDSIRLCRNDGIWSGTEPQCLLKTCAALRAPLHGRIRCEHEEEEEEKINHANLTAYPIDTRCQFRCDNGFQLRGSKVRNCLPVSRWDGLKVTCKQIKCEPLSPISNGNITPEMCTGPKKLAFSTNCTFTCNEGFALVGPKKRHCTGKNGIWSQRHTVNQCIDKTPPIITCPMNSTWETLTGKNYAVVNWTIPIATDNSDKIPNVWSRPHVKLPWKAKIGSHRIFYIAQDSSGNKAKCKFVVRVIDKEPPIIENCVDPPIFLTAGKNDKANVTWNEPIFHDNSGVPVKIVKSHLTPNCNCSLGETQIFYEATDVFNNTARCVMNITLEDPCENIPVVTSGKAHCENIEEDTKKCVITCDDGYDFTIDHSDYSDHGKSVILTCGYNGKAWNITDFPDCSVTEVPSSIGRDVDVILQGNVSVCDNARQLHQLTDQIAGDFTSKILDICGNDIECNLVKYDPKCSDETVEENEIASNAFGRRKRESDHADNGKNDTKNTRALDLRSKITSNGKNKSPAKRKKGKIEIKFRFIGKIIAENRNNPKLAIKKLREKIEAMTRSGKLNLFSNRTNHELAKLALNLNTIFKEAGEICEAGRVLKKHNCVKCPMGTFHNTTRDRCQACYFGEFQNSTAATVCTKCPQHTFTKKMHSKKISDCLPVCKPGYYSRRKIHQVSSVGLEPCTKCPIGYYQTEYGKKKCHLCPNDKTTVHEGSTSSNDCFDLTTIDDPCSTLPCLNGGCCTSEKGSFTCDCQENYVGSTCEKRQNPCESSPCLNDGECKFSNSTETKVSYSCNCRTGFTGQNCQIYIDECSLTPCQNGGSCISTEKDYYCVCNNGYEGDFCETEINHCEPWTCEAGSTCITVEGTWRCLCKPGFLGPRCNLLPCDWIPCRKNAICLNVEETNTTRKSYRCVCPDGYEGDDCAIRINHCKDLPCENGGNCVNGLLNYTCECPITHSGITCEKELSSDFVLNFAETGTNDYVIMKGPKENITEFTVCLWLQSVDTFNYGTVLSYATKYQDNALTLTDYNGFVLYVNGEKVVTDITLNDGYWHFLCVDWRNDDGSWNAYVDGVRKDGGQLLSEKTIISANGTIVIGQEQDRIGGGFSAAEAFLGKIAYLDIWDAVIGAEAIGKFYKYCDDYHGSIVAWAQTRQNIRGRITILDGIFCRGCPTSIIPLRAYINMSEDRMEIIYSCETGYSVRVGNVIGTNYRRRCLKHGDWEGFHNPICTRVKCGHPGFFPRGRITGRSFMYGDEIRYSCEEGYELRGNPHRVCNAHGNWSGMQPICIGVTCKNLLAPENGDLEYIIEEHERDDISILQVGQQLEFKCDEGFELSGKRYLTCLSTGKWNHPRPTCVPSGCLPPKAIKNGHLSMKRSTILPAHEKFNTTTEISKVEEATTPAIYSFGDVVVVLCNDGYKYHDNNGNATHAESSLRCSTNGSWAGLVQDCVRVQCPTPSYVNNGRIFLFYENNTEIELNVNTTTNNNNNNNESNKLETDIDVFESLAAAENDEMETTSEKKDVSFVPGATIKIFCDDGYGTDESITRICLENENWSSEEFNCTKRHCPMEDNPVLKMLFENIKDRANIGDIRDKASFVDDALGNLFFTRTGSFYGDEIVVACNNDSRLNLEVIGKKEEIKNLTWRCEKDGKWRIQNGEFDETKLTKILMERSEICRGIDCRLVQIFPNAYVDDTDKSSEDVIIRKANETVTIRCRSGYDLEGSQVVTCLSNGVWTTLPTCKPVTCKNPPKVSNAFLENASSRIMEYSYGNTISYKCVLGYRIYGQANAKCLANGKWSRIHGKCSKISCGKPKIPPGVAIYGRSYLYQEELIYKCPNGLTKGSIICRSDGKWSDPPDCDAKQ